ncbi:FkbM family methyltransferase [Flavobacterium cauense R2A-7]|uniref:FkbM family methyltransferase n=1 Tax=Flavobacterium cauense R2A-7 TaxID=1341154 RepID=A0A562LZU6_9FLAO|nr:FkbM family methyltransferase [Flavobacterium cauense]TWI13217.1 FkbM family methyltransferase [Flavobacterium cauense R2A-7]
MNKFIYKNKSILLKLKRLFNAVTGIEIVKYPTDELSRRIALLKHHNIDAILDIGANIGQYGGEMRNLGFKGTIFSFEPMKEAYGKLVKNAAGDSNWKTFNFSIGEKDGQTTINVAKNSVSSSLLDNLPQLTESAPEAAFVEKETIEIRKLDSIFDELNLTNKNVYLKIDTQGYEEMVLLGAQESLKKVKGIQIEMSFIPSYKGTLTFEEIKTRLTNSGFQLVAIENGFYDRKTGKQLEVDGIFYRK